jgi:hypothetical protein
MTRLSFGILPSQKEFNHNFARICKDSNNKFSFGNDPIVGDCELNMSELWDELNSVLLQWETSEGEVQDELGSWMSCVLSVLEFEWI